MKSVISIRIIAYSCNARVRNLNNSFMKQKAKGCLFLFIIFLIFILGFGFLIHKNNKNNESSQKLMDSLMGNIQFKGKVIKSNVFKYGGKDYYMVCVKLDYANTQNFYVNNDVVFLKIKDGIASIAAGFLSSYGVMNYVEF